MPGEIPILQLYELRCSDLPPPARYSFCLHGWRCFAPLILFTHGVKERWYNRSEGTELVLLYLVRPMGCGGDGKREEGMREMFWKEGGERKSHTK